MADMPIVDLSEPVIAPRSGAEAPPSALVRKVAELHLDGCRCPWQLKPRTGWVRLSTGPRCPHHDPKYRREHLEETLRQIVPRGHVYAEGLTGNAAKLNQIAALLWGEDQ
jgi:hypothetical protein